VGGFEERVGGFGGCLLVDEVEEVLFVDFHWMLDVRCE
jgi:hypothetical protein